LEPVCRPLGTANAGEAVLLVKLGEGVVLGPRLAPFWHQPWP